MNKILIILIIIGALNAKSGGDVIEITRVNWVRMELTALYGAYSMGEKDIFINFHSTQYKDVIKVKVLFRKGVSERYKAEWSKYIKDCIENTRTNMRADEWLSFTYQWLESE